TGQLHLLHVFQPRHRPWRGGGVQHRQRHRHLRGARPFRRAARSGGGDAEVRERVAARSVSAALGGRLQAVSATRVIRAWLLLACASLPVSAAAAAPAYDLWIRGGTVVDGSGSDGYRADVLVRGGTIVRIDAGGSPEAEAARTVD